MRMQCAAQARQTWSRSREDKGRNGLLITGVMTVESEMLSGRLYAHG